MRAVDRGLLTMSQPLVLGLLSLWLLATPTAAQLKAEPPQAPAPRPVGSLAPKDSGPFALLGKETYLTPPPIIAEAVLAARNEIVTLTNLSPDGRKFLIAKRDGLPSLERLACPCVHLAEMAFDPVACRARELWVNSSEAFELFYPKENRTVAVRSPAGARVGNPVWSPDGSKLAFFAFFPEATHICVAETESGGCRTITKTPVLATLVATFQWSRDGKRIQTVLLPEEGKRPLPRPEPVATEPKVRVAREGKDPSRTYRYLLETPYQMHLLEYLCSGQLALIDVADSKVETVGAPNMIRSVTPAPGEKQFRVAVVKKPFSYYAPFSRFGTLEGIWDRAGKTLFTLSDRPLRESEPQPVTAANPAPPGATPLQGRVSGRNGGAGAAPPATNPNPDLPPAPPLDPDDPNAAPAPSDPDGKRELSWRADGNGFSYLQLEPVKAKDDKSPQKDRVMQWLPPFGKDDAKVLYETAERIIGVQYSEDCRWIFLTQNVDGQRRITGIDLTEPKTSYVISQSTAAGGGAKRDGTTPKKGDQEETEDSEQPPAGRGGAGGLNALGLMSRSAGVASVVRISKAGEVYLTGSDRNRMGDATFARPTIDAINIKTGKKTRIFEGKGDALETVDGVDGNDITCVFTTRQKADLVPDSYMTDLLTGKVTKLTNNVDRSAWFHELKVERIRVTRIDGFKFWVKVTTPPNTTGKLPALFWIYPREYVDQAAYDAATARGTGTDGSGAGGAGRFTTSTPRNMAILTRLGYALIEPDVPIVGPAGRMNDNYVPDLRNSLWAAIDELDKRGIIDRDRLACGGHSYGAFSTANALAHTPFFKAGIAGDGCYNRTLTTMTFQTERRQLWDARETYLEMSPLLWANRVNGALLMYHGMEDANVGTNPINSEQLFMALDGLGKDAALYMYPYENHGPIARETMLDLWARWVIWLDTYVKNPKKK